MPVPRPTNSARLNTPSRSVSKARKFPGCPPVVWYSCRVRTPSRFASRSAKRAARSCAEAIPAVRPQLAARATMVFKCITSSSVNGRLRLRLRGSSARRRTQELLVADPAVTVAVDAGEGAPIPIFCARQEAIPIPVLHVECAARRSQALQGAPRDVVIAAVRPGGTSARRSLDADRLVLSCPLARFFVFVHRVRLLLGHAAPAHELAVAQHAVPVGVEGA